MTATNIVFKFRRFGVDSPPPPPPPVKSQKKFFSHQNVPQTAKLNPNS